MNNTKHLRHALCAMVLLGVVKQASSMHFLQESTKRKSDDLRMIEGAIQKYKRDMVKSEEQDQLYVEKITKEVDEKWNKIFEEEQLRWGRMSEEEQLAIPLETVYLRNYGDGGQDKQNAKERGYNKFYIEYLKSRFLKKKTPKKSC